MFNKRINELTLVSDIANEYFRKIQGDGYNNDFSFLATLRALLNKRIPCEANGIHLSINASRYDEDLIREAGHDSLFRAINAYDDYNSNGLSIHSLESTDSGNEAFLEKFDDAEYGFATQHHWRELNDLRQFAQSKANMNARFYINEEIQSMFIVVANLELRKYHFLQSMIPRYFPWYFKDDPLNEEETSLLASLTHRYAVEYERIIAAIGDRIDFRDHIIKSIVRGFEKASRQNELQRIQNSIRQIRDKLNQYMSMYSQTYAEFDSLNMQQSGLENAIASISNDSELVEYFCCNKNITPTHSSNGSLQFTVKTYLESYDPEIYRSYYRNKYSGFYRGYDYQDAFSSLAARRRILDALFSDEPKMKVLMCANYIIDLRHGVSAQRQYPYGAELADYMPNPHIHKHACIGNNIPYINDCLRNGDILGAIEQCVASAKNVNFAENWAIQWVMAELFNGRRRMIELPDKRHVTPIEALEYLDGADAPQEEDENV